MARYIYAHWLKTKNTPLRLICGILTVLYALILFFYFYTHQRLALTAFTEYRIFFLFLTICTLFTLSVVIPLLLTPDRAAGIFANELRIGISRTKLFISRFLLILLLVAGVQCLSVFIFTILEAVFLGHIITISLLLLFMGTSFLFLLPMISFYQWLALRFHYSGTLLAGIFFTLTSILLGTTGLGTFIWLFLPWVWPIRLIYYEISPSFDVISDYGFLGFLSFLLTIVLMAIVVFWYNSWEGKTSLED
ncbi:hypothetical protein [Tetragenococcus solitarius]|uniref:Lantibiotic ABC transporter permease n=1 Tax=Tetragenococcus solitarius TaxID=71453 RepID=A0ABN3Y5Z4_9ENTE|nr:hypothetical protein [Tetragenococcus solitarius]